jgi:transposase-like protein
MSTIIPGILSLDQYLNAQKETPERFRPAYCPHCGKAGLHNHGHYDRKADRNSGTHNPIHIPRFFCQSCHRTCSTLPECIPPRRWYLWSIQQAALILVFFGVSLTTAAKEVAPSRHTISRWFERLKERFRFHKDVLYQHFIDLSRTDNFAGFWPACFRKLSLSQAMYLCHVAGVNIP